MEPVARRPKFPPGYGVPEDEEDLLPWSYVRERFREAKHYWIAVVDPAGLPIARPVDGVWADDRLYFWGEPGARWRRALDRNPVISLHLEDAERVVIAEGTVQLIRLERALAQQLVDEANRKYELGQSIDLYDGEEI